MAKAAMHNAAIYVEKSLVYTIVGNVEHIFEAVISEDVKEHEKILDHLNPILDKDEFVAKVSGCWVNAFGKYVSFGGVDLHFQRSESWIHIFSPRGI